MVATRRVFRTGLWPNFCERNLDEFFITSLRRDTYSFSYRARATTVGQFTALPAQAYAMYDLSFWGRSERTDIEITR